jgi:hypothetical protein
VFATISPWNFPLAIFIGMASAALAAGNSVIAKPAEQTPLIAALAVKLCHEAGIPPEAFQLLPGAGQVGQLITADPRLAGVAFTGSTETARAINRALANRDGPIATLIAETGGQNAMIVDSSALPEQVVRDVLGSAFQSAGQRCSALRVLYLQEDIAGTVLEMIHGGSAALKVGDPAELATDIGPVIDAEAKGLLEAHIAESIARGFAVTRLPGTPATGHFGAPTMIDIGSICDLAREHGKRRLDRFHEQRVVQPRRDRRAVFGIEQLERKIGLGRDALQHLARKQLVLAGQHGRHRRAGPAHAFGQQRGGERAKLLVVGSDRLPAARARLARQPGHKTLHVEPHQAGVAGKGEQVEAGLVESHAHGCAGPGMADLVPVVVEKQQRAVGVGHA